MNTILFGGTCHIRILVNYALLDGYNYLYLADVKKLSISVQHFTEDRCPKTETQLLKGTNYGENFLDMEYKTWECIINFIHLISKNRICKVIVF